MVLRGGSREKEDVGVGRMDKDEDEEDEVVGVGEEGEDGGGRWGEWMTRVPPRLSISLSHPLTNIAHPHLQHPRHCHHHPPQLSSFHSELSPLNVFPGPLTFCVPAHKFKCMF